MSAGKAVAGVAGLLGLGMGYERVKTGSWKWPWQWWGKASPVPQPGPGPGQPSVINPPDHPNPPPQAPALPASGGVVQQPAGFIVTDSAAGSSADQTNTGTSGGSAVDDLASDVASVDDTTSALDALAAL